MTGKVLKMTYELVHQYRKECMGHLPSTRLWTRTETQDRWVESTAQASFLSCNEDLSGGTSLGAGRYLWEQRRKHCLGTWSISQLPRAGPDPCSLCPAPLHLSSTIPGWFVWCLSSNNFSNWELCSQKSPPPPSCLTSCVCSVSLCPAPDCCTVVQNQENARVSGFYIGGASSSVG